MTYKPENIIFLAVIGIVAAGIGIIAWTGWRQMEDAGYESCIHSVMDHLHRDLVNDRIEPKGYALTLPLDGRWKVLTVTESKAMLSQTRGSDCGGTSDITKDLWGRDSNVALRRTTERIEVVVWSNGRDGVSGTSDDIVAPHGHDIPK